MGDKRVDRRRFEDGSPLSSFSLRATHYQPQRPPAEARDVSRKTKWDPSLSFSAQVSSKTEHLKNPPNALLYTHVDVRNMSPLHCRQRVTVKRLDVGD